MRFLSLSRSTQLVWHALVLLTFACLPVLKYGALWTSVPHRELLVAAALMAAYGASATAAMIFSRTDGWAAAGRALAITLSLFGLVLFAFVLARLTIPRYLLLPIFAMAVALVPLSVTAQPVRLAGIAALAVGLIVIGVLSARAMRARDEVAATADESLIKTAFYALRMVSHRGVVPMPATRGGGLDHLGNDVLLSTGDGHLYILSTGPDDALKARELPTLVPLNRDEFAAAFGGSSRAPQRSIDYSEAGPPRVQTWRFRVADTIVQDRGTTVRILASHHYWNAKDRCFLVRVSQTEVSKERLGAASTQEDFQWQTIFDSEPCIPMSGPHSKRGKNPFRGEEIGGRMALLDERTLLLTVGDHGFYGMESPQAFSQDPQASYGKTIRIDLDTHAHEVNTLGHRNPQGLYVTPDGRVWETEHAAQGGDELNVLARGTNYGWPLVTYGTEYGEFAWPGSQQQNRHDGFAQPVYAWVPSIGVSSLIRIERDRFATWKGDLLAGSLATRALYRIVTDGERVVVDEAIPVGHRIRDLLELSDGRVLLWTDDAALVFVEPASGMSTSLQFATACAGCHTIVDGQAHRLGPDLFQVVGRNVASTTFGEYSPALKSFGGDWSRERLDAYLRDPQAAVPGTTMGFAGIADDQQRAALIDYLRTVSERREKNPNRRE
jgi:cytochrome c2